MVKKSPTPWLADFVSAEIRQVIDWKRTLSDNIKPDPDSRFDDDGSNFRSVATDLPTHCSLQLIEVILANHQPTVVVSDGHTRIKARLSQDTVSVLEDEAGAKFTNDMLNDVFQPALLTVISTPLGTPDGFIQLYIDGIEYEHHLRRSEGQPSPIEENESVQILLDDIRKIRCAGLPSSDPHDFESAGVAEPALDSPRSTISQQFHEPPRLPTSAALVRDSARKNSPASRINSAIQTQRVISRKKAGPNLDRDGFEVESGLNLDCPLQAAANNAPDTNAGRSALAPNAQSDHLLGLLGGKTGGKRSREESPPMHHSPVVVAESPSNVVQGVDSAGHSTTASGKDAQNLSSTAPPSAQPPPKQTQASLRSSGNLGVPYGRRKMPVNQCKLLDRKDSWLPSMPGQSFPSPNVPIELLTKWNALMKNAPEILRMSQATDVAVEALPGDEVDSSGEESEDGSDSDKEFGPSQWGSSPPARAVELPPDSSFESVVRGSQQDELRVAPPRAMPTARTAASAATLRNAPPPKPASSASREEYGSWERSARRDGPIHPPRGPRSSRENHGSWERSAMRGDTGHPPRGPRSSLAEFSSPARSQPTRPSQTRYQDHSSRFERRSPRRLHGDDAETDYDGSRWRPQSSLRERRPSPAHSPQGRPSSRVMPDRTIDQSPRRSIAGRSPSGVWTTTQTSEESPRRPVMNGNATAMSPPTGPRAMALDRHRSPYAETPSRASIPQSQLSVDRSARALPFPNVPMVGRRKSGAPPHSSPREPTANTPNGHVYRNDNPSKPEESRPPTSSHRSVIPGTQMAEPPSRPANDARDDRPVGTHEPRREQHPDERYREVRREHTWHYKRQDWVKEFYHPDPSGDVPFENVFHTYRINHKTKRGKNVKNDHALTIENFTAAVQDAFPDDDTTQPLDMRFRPLKAAKRKGHMSKGGANDRTRDPSPSEPDTTTTHADQPRRANGVLQTNGSAGQNQEGQTGSRKQESPKEGTSTSARSPREGTASTQTAAAGPAGAGGGGGAELGVSARQRRNNVPDIGRLAREWLRVRPGGAFAGPQQQQGQTVRRRVDVLSWDV